MSPKDSLSDVSAETGLGGFSVGDGSPSVGGVTIAREGFGASSSSEFFNEHMGASPLSIGS